MNSRQNRFLALLSSVLLVSSSGAAREHAAPTAQISIHSQHAGCAVDLDSQSAGKTNAAGDLALTEVDPGEHYIHVRCPDQERATAYFVSVRAGESVAIKDEKRDQNAGSDPTVEPAEAKIKLRELVREAVQMRSRGRLADAIKQLRDAAKMDPENSDLHREMGITFLLDKDWKSARIEMLEALRHDPSDADAHNGLGYALEKLGEMASAVKEYQTAMRLEPDDASYRQHYFDAVSRQYASDYGKKKAK